MPVRQDAVSRLILLGMIAATLFLIVMLASFDPLLMPLFLLLGGLALRVYIRRAKVPTDQKISKTEKHSIVTWTIIPLVGLAIISYVIGHLWIPPQVSLISNFALAFSLLMAVAETYYFQGELYPSLSVIGGGGLGLFGVTGLGVFYHLRVYGTQLDKLVYVAVGYFLLTLAVHVTKRLTPALLAHGTNNFLSATPVFMPILALLILVYVVVNRNKIPVGNLGRQIKW